MLKNDPENILTEQKYREHLYEKELSRIAKEVDKMEGDSDPSKVVSTRSDQKVPGLFKLRGNREC